MQWSVYLPQIWYFFVIQREPLRFHFDVSNVAPEMADVMMQIKQVWSLVLKKRQVNMELISVEFFNLPFIIFY